MLTVFSPWSRLEAEPAGGTADEELSVEWLHWLLEELMTERDSYLVVEPLDREQGYVQFLVEDDGSLVAETISNTYLFPGSKLSPEEELRLLEMGWESPSADALEDPDGARYPNFHAEWGSPVPLRRAATLTLRTLREIYGVTLLERLRVVFFRDDPEEG